MRIKNRTQEDGQKVQGELTWAWVGSTHEPSHWAMCGTHSLGGLIHSEGIENGSEACSEGCRAHSPAVYPVP
jgi:hypothetical protein